MTYSVLRRIRKHSKNLGIGLRAGMIAGLLATGLSGSISTAHATSEGISKGRVTGLPIPRFVSLKSRAVNLRVGPGRKFAIAWLYKKRGLPVEVIQEFDRWRRIRDSEGTTGWVLHSLLSSKRTAIVAPWETNNAMSVDKGEETSEQPVREASLFAGKQMASSNASTVAHLQAGLLVSVEECENGWCEVEAQSTKAWMKQDVLWGVYPNEGIND